MVSFSGSSSISDSGHKGEISIHPESWSKDQVGVVLGWVFCSFLLTVHKTGFFMLVSGNIMFWCWPFFDLNPCRIVRNLFSGIYQILDLVEERVGILPVPWLSPGDENNFGQKFQAVQKFDTLQSPYPLLLKDQGASNEGKKWVALKAIFGLKKLCCGKIIELRGMHNLNSNCTGNELKLWNSRKIMMCLLSNIAFTGEFSVYRPNVSDKYKCSDSKKS